MKPLGGIGRVLRRPPSILAVLFAASLILPNLAGGSSFSQGLNQSPQAQNTSHQSAAARPSPNPAKSSSNAAGQKSSKRRRSRSRRPRGQKAPTPERIREIQLALARDGYYQHEPNGKWDAASLEAMKRFQQAHGLEPTGKLDARSLQRLGLGSDTAGVGAPRPTPAPAPAGTAHP